GDDYDHMGWAAFMAGGSMAVIPSVADAGFITAASAMKPVDAPNKDQYTLADAGKGYIIYSNAATITIDLTGVAGTFKVKYIEPNTGALIGKEEKIKGGKPVSLKNVKQ